MHLQKRPQLPVILVQFLDLLGSLHELLVLSLALNAEGLKDLYLVLPEVVDDLLHLRHIVCEHFILLSELVDLLYTKSYPRQ